MARAYILFFLRSSVFFDFLLANVGRHVYTDMEPSGKWEKQMKRLSVDEIMGMKPCEAYPEARVQELFGERETLSLIQILDLDIPAKDRLRVMLRKGVVEEEVLRRFSDVVANRAVRNHALTFGPIREWAAKWLSGADRSEWSAHMAFGRACDMGEPSVIRAAEVALETAEDAAGRAGRVAWIASEQVEFERMAQEFERQLQVEDMRWFLLEAEA